MEDVTQPYPANIEAFGLSVFVTHQVFNEFCAQPGPYVSAAFYERMSAGERLILTPKQVRQANAASGLSVLVLHFGLRNQDISDSRTAQALLVGSAAFYFVHSGYRTNAVLYEVYGLQQAHYMERGGFRLMRDFHRESPGAFKHLAPEEYPYRFELRREWMEPAAVHPLSQMFHPPPPRLGLTESEQRVLEGALLNEPDLEIASRLGISADSVKKKWRNIYHRVDRCLPNLIPKGDQALLGTRGQEKRRYLLNYVRMHLEELRPAVPGPGPGRTRLGGPPR